MEITAQIVGQERVIAMLRRFPVEAQAGLNSTAQRLAIELMMHVKQNKLTGQVLNVRSGRLRGSINKRVLSSDSSVELRVGTNVPYGRTWELGFSGDVSVPEHFRRGRSGLMHSVRAHTRRVTMPKRSFLVSALNDLKPKMVAEMTAAVQRAARQS